MRGLAPSLLLRGTIVIATLVSLSACSLLYPEDPREGVEAAETCILRVTNTLSDDLEAQLDAGAGRLVPTYTYDITKLGLEGLQTLTVPGSDETAGARLIASTNEMSTAVTRFKTQSVDEKGAFFLATDPALYRVRGPGMNTEQVIANGCERQLAGMRLIDVSVDLPAPARAQESVEAAE